MTARNVLVIEDNHEIAGLLSLHLKDMGCRVQLEQDGQQGLSHARSNPPDLIVLDLMLPGMDGIEICRQLRQDDSHTPILMLTARSSETDRVAGLDTGADDYMIKPFSIPEFLARVKAMFRRQENFSQPAGSMSTSVRAGRLHLDMEKRFVSVGGNAIDLTAREFDLLVQFATHPGRVYTRSQLLDLVWGHNNSSFEHTVNSHINRLRAKIETDPAKPDYVLTVWGVGYKFSDRFDR
ncbi:MAG: response regulator transcription factor [Rhodospirillaceae bacterium]|jgi:DNA-binding response OmpR family regulator|nr:response regulator transcription factor [Rhodospirillaceae bacterium]MBT5456456.1 response regulator transcription factor [Rhodospirillaceae bacterium]